MSLEPQVSRYRAVDGPSPSQTAGPYIRLGMGWWRGEDLVEPGSPGAVEIAGRMLDGAGVAVPDGMLEIWQADAAGRLNGGSGYGRSLTDDRGHFRFTTVRPGCVDDRQAPHIDVSVFARGLLQRLVTRIYFPDEAANSKDPVLASLAADRRATLIARSEGPGLAFDVRLQGEGETVFFAW